MSLSHKKEWNLAIYAMNASKWNKSEKDKNVWDYMWILKHKTTITHTEKKWAVARGDGVGDERNRWRELRGTNI